VYRDDGTRRKAINYAAVVKHTPRQSLPTVIMNANSHVINQPVALPSCFAGSWALAMQKMHSHPLAVPTVSYKLQRQLYRASTTVSKFQDANVIFLCP